MEEMIWVPKNNTPFSTSQWIALDGLIEIKPWNIIDYLRHNQRPWICLIWLHFMFMGNLFNQINRYLHMNIIILKKC
jgi:hypothetical protein